MLCLQVDILHPLTTLKWERCGHLPRELRDDSTKCVVLGEKIYMSSGTRIYVSTDLNSWTELPELPYRHGTLTTYRSQLVLVGGGKVTDYENFSDEEEDYYADDEDYSDNKDYLHYEDDEDYIPSYHDTVTFANKFWTLSKAGVWQKSLPPKSTECYHPVVVSEAVVLQKSLPPWRSTKCYHPVVVSATDPECLIVMGTYGVGRSFMAVLIGDQLFGTEKPPSNYFQGGIVHNGMLYIHGSDIRDQIFCCDFQSLIASCRHPDPNNQLRWSEISSMYAISILSFRQQLVMVCKKEMFAYQPLTDRMPWVSLGHIPISKGVALSTFLHAGGLFVLIADQDSYFEFIIMRLSLTSKCSV